MTTDHAALLAGAREAMDGITRGGWEAFVRGNTIAVTCPKKSEERGILYEIISWTGFDGSSVGTLQTRESNAVFIAWAGNGGVRRLVEAVEDRDKLEAALRNAEAFCVEHHHDYDQEISVCKICKAVDVNVPGHADDCPFAALPKLEASHAG